MRKIMKAVLIVATILMVRAKAQPTEQVTRPQKTAEGEGINPKLWFRLAFVNERADLFTHWERIHPHRVLPGAAVPRVYKRNTRPVDEVTYDLDGETYKLTDYIERANVAGLMVLREGEVRLEYYGHGIDADSRFHIWSATKRFTATLIGLALFEGSIISLDDTVEQ